MRASKFSALYSYTRGSRGAYGISVLATLAATFFSLIDPLIIRAALDYVLGGVPLAAPRWVVAAVESMGGRSRLASALWLLGLGLVGVNAVGGLFLFLRGRYSAVAAERTAERLRNRLYRHFQDLPYGYHVKAETGDLIQRSTSDVETIRRFLATQLAELARAVFLVVASASIMLAIDLRMGLISMVLVPGVFAYSFLYFSKIQKAFKTVDESESRMTSVLQENLSGIRVVRAFAREDFEIERFDRKNREYTGVTVRLIDLFGWYWSVSSVICLVQMALVLVLGGYFAAKGYFSLGTMVVFFSYTTRLLWPVREMGRILTELGKTTVSTRRIQEILEIPGEREEEGGLKPEILGTIEFRGVSLEYEEGKKVLDGISLKVERGETIAILGRAGSGKSSLMHLLVRLYEPSSGSILIDGIDIRDMDKRYLRDRVSLVLQEPFLFSRSLQENLAVARPRANDGEIEEAIRTAALRSAIADFEKGLETAVGEEGVTLSGGQRQRVAIARTLLKDAPILVLDDSLSAVDTETDSHIRAALASDGRTRTTFVIAHRVSTLAEADRIVVLDGGRIVQVGNHEQLAQEEGLYRRIWRLQSELKEELLELHAADNPAEARKK